MALVTDGGISTIADLQALDSSILETARVEGIGVPAKLGIADTAVRLELAAFLSRVTTVEGNPESVLKRVVVTPGLQRWHSLRALAEVYADAYGSQLNDRYLGKWNSFQQMARESSELLFDLGVGMVSTPVPRAGPPAIATVVGEGSGGIYLIQVAWRNYLGQTGAAGEAAMCEAAPGQAIVVDAGTAPADCTSFDVFVGLSEGDLSKQNLEPVPAGSNWRMPATGTVKGARAGAGQPAEYFVRRRRNY